MLICAICSQSKYDLHEPEPPHPAKSGAAPCAGYQPENPCANCGQDCELHDPEAPHPAPDFHCEAAQPPPDFPKGGFGGGGASGGW